MSSPRQQPFERSYNLTTDRAFVQPCLSHWGTSQNQAKVSARCSSFLFGFDAFHLPSYFRVLAFSCSSHLLELNASEKSRRSSWHVSTYECRTLPLSIAVCMLCLDWLKYWSDWCAGHGFADAVCCSSQAHWWKPRCGLNPRGSGMGLHRLRSLCRSNADNVAILTWIGGRMIT